MIGVLGSFPISSVRSAGLNEFVSLLRTRPSRAYSDVHDRSYVKTRGIIINKDFLKDKPIDLNRGYQFQFNPQTIEDIKTTLYGQRNYPGLPYVDHVWGGGGERLITFELFLDNTPASHTPAFRPTEYGSKNAMDLNSANTNGYGDGDRLQRAGSRNYFGKGVTDEINSIYDTLKSQVKPDTGQKQFDFTGDAFSITRVHERGVLPEVELLQSFLYPAPKNGEATPKFAEGGVVKMNQFRPPAIAVLCVGPIYLEGVLRALPVKYTLFDTDLTPIRATVNVEFAVYEFMDVTRQIENKK